MIKTGAGRTGNEADYLGFLLNAHHSLHDRTAKNELKHVAVYLNIAAA